MINFLNNFFKLKLNNTDVKSEIIAGLTTFLTMAYIIFVNPQIMEASGMDTLRSVESIKIISESNKSTTEQEAALTRLT